MEHIKNIIDNNRDYFESGSLPVGHKERFLKKQRQSRLKANAKIISYSFAAAVILALIIIPPIFRNNSTTSYGDSISNSYIAKINEESDLILSMIKFLDTSNKEIVLNTLDQLVFEAIPFEEQLPYSLSREERELLEQTYYYPKIEGLERLKGYVAQLVEL